MRNITYALTAVLALIANPVLAVNITDDFSSLGTVYQDNSTGILSNTFSAGSTNVTSAFEADANYAASMLGKAVGVNFNETISISLFNLTSESAVGDSSVQTLYANGLPSSSIIRVDNTSQSFFVDPTPANNSNFNMTSASATLGGGTVNVSRIGNAVPGGLAVGKYDLVTLFTHEMLHSIAYTTAIPNFVTQAGNTGAANRHITVPNALSGLPLSFDIPIVSGSSHIDGVVNSGEFNDAVVAEPGFGDSQRALLTAIDIYGACVVDGCTADELNTDPYALSSVPLPPAGEMMLIAILGLFGVGFARHGFLGRRAVARANDF